MNTIKLFQENVYLKEVDAKVLAAEPLAVEASAAESPEASEQPVAGEVSTVHQSSAAGKGPAHQSPAAGEGSARQPSPDTHKIRILLEQTIFFPTGGGQSCDLGTIGGFPVVDVFEADEKVYHVIDTAGSDLPLPETDSTVKCVLDWERRFDNMQRHCGEHILSGMFYREFGGVNRGFHMGDEYMTVDISLEENSDFDEVTWKMALHVERCTNAAIWANLPVTTRRFDAREEAENLPLRKALAIDEEISIVCVGSEENPSDCVACCGTHPSTSGQVGLLKIYKVEKNKGMWRIYFDAGQRAMADYDAKHDLLTRLGSRYSAGTDDLLDKISAHDEKNKAVRDRLYKLSQSVIKERAEAISAALDAACSANSAAGEGIVDAADSTADPNAAAVESTTDHDPAALIIYEYPDLTIDDILKIGRLVADKAEKPVCIIAPSENTLLLFSNGKVDCGRLVKEYAPVYQGKGGGNATSARAIFPKREGLDTFIDLIGKHLR